MFEENSDGEFKKLRFQNVFRPHENKKPVFLNFSGLRNVFEKLRFRDGLVWTVKIKAPFSNFSGVVWMGPKVDYHSEDIKARVSRLRLASFSNLIVKNSLGGKLLHF